MEAREEPSAWERECLEHNVTACQPVDTCMWHLGGCRPCPVKPERLHCMDGGNFTECFDVETCASQHTSSPTADKKWAFVLTHSAPQDFNELNQMNVEPLLHFAEEMGNT